MKPWDGRRIKKRERWIHIPRILHFTHWTSLWKCHFWVTLTVPSSHPEEDFAWQWCSYTTVVHIWAASLSGDLVHWRPCWLHWGDRMKIITAASSRYRLVLFLKYKGSNIIKEIPGNDLGLLLSWFGSYSLCVPKLDCSWIGWLCSQNNVKWHFSAKAEIIAISVIVISCICVPAYPQNRCKCLNR